MSKEIFISFDLNKQLKVLESIAKACLPRIYLASDGPKDDKLGEKDKVASIREFLLNNITWKCEIKTLFSDTNLGCKKTVSSAINWFFAHETQGIIFRR